MFAMNAADICPNSFSFLSERRVFSTIPKFGKFLRKINILNGFLQNGGGKGTRGLPRRNPRFLLAMTAPNRHREDAQCPAGSTCSATKAHLYLTT